METNETLQNTEPVSDGNALPQTVSGGDAQLIMTMLENESAQSSELLAEVQRTNEYLEQLSVEILSEPETIWTKPLAEYTVGESLGLITVCLIVGIIVFKVVGGIIQCKL